MLSQKTVIRDFKDQTTVDSYIRESLGATSQVREALIADIDRFKVQVVLNSDTNVDQCRNLTFGLGISRRSAISTLSQQIFDFAAKKSSLSAIIVAEDIYFTLFDHRSQDVEELILKEFNGVSYALASLNDCKLSDKILHKIFNFPISFVETYAVLIAPEAADWSNESATSLIARIRNAPLFVVSCYDQESFLLFSRL